jgi:hypothetical protein
MPDSPRVLRGGGLVYGLGFRGGARGGGETAGEVMAI